MLTPRPRRPWRRARRFDLALSRALQGAGGDVYFLTDAVQARLRARCAGLAPPGACVLVPLPEEVRGPARNAWGARALAVLPTMRVPQEVRWHRDLAYNAMWALLAEVARWNAEADARGGAGAGEGGEAEGERIERVVMTGIGTGAGGVGAERCARLMVLAAKHFGEGLPEKVRWESVGRRMEEVEEAMAATETEPEGGEEGAAEAEGVGAEGGEGAAGETSADAGEEEDADAGAGTGAGTGAAGARAGPAGGAVGAGGASRA